MMILSNSDNDRKFLLSLEKVVAYSWPSFVAFN